MADAITTVARHLDFLLYVVALDRMLSLEGEAARSQRSCLLFGSGRRGEIVVHPCDTGLHGEECSLFAVLAGRIHGPDKTENPRGWYSGGMSQPLHSDIRMHPFSASSRALLQTRRFGVCALSLGLMLFGSIGCTGGSTVASDASLQSAVVARNSDPLLDVPDDFELEIKVLVGRKVTDQDVLERREVHIVLFPDGTLHAAAGIDVIPGARPGLARTLLRGQVADVWALLGRLDLREAGEPPTSPVRPPGLAEIVHVVEVTANGERLRSGTRFVGSSQDSVTTTLVRSIGGLAWLTDAPPSGNDIIPIRYDFGPDPWARYRSAAE